MSVVKKELDKVPFDEFGFQKISESIIGEREERIDQVKRSLSFGVKFLDTTLRAIEIDDFIVVGALPGVGKTQLVVNIALQNALKGKRVHLFALEAGRKEVERRMKFSLTMKLYYQHTKNYDFKIAYYDWYRGAAYEVLQSYEEEAERDLAKLDNLKVFYRSQSFGVRQFKRTFLGIAEETDLVIIDHLHYFDLDDKDENKAVKDIMVEMRDLVLIKQKPLILVAHLRKLDKTEMSLAPELSEFHGTSEIGKIVTKAITLGPGEHLGNGKYSSFVRAAKCRQDSGVTRFLLKVIWDASNNEYLENFKIGVEGKGRAFKEINTEERAKRPLFLVSQEHNKENE